jgi:addiction module HigA family antidote
VNGHAPRHSPAPPGRRPSRGISRTDGFERLRPRKAIRVTRGRVNDIFLGRQGITAAIALRLGRFFGVDAQWFINMQSKYDLHVQAERLAAVEPRSAA